MALLLTMDSSNKYPPLDLKQSFMRLVQQNWRKFIKGSYTYQFSYNWLGKLIFSKKISNIGKNFTVKSCSNKIEPVKQKLVVRQNHIMTNPVDNSPWQQVEWLKIQLETNFIEQKIHWA